MEAAAQSEGFKDELCEQNTAFVSRLKLSDYRNYACLDLALESGPVVLFGANGAGKTNLLEALSFLSPGRGLRRSAYDEIASEACGQWSLFTQITTSRSDDVASVGVGWRGGTDTLEGVGKLLRINGEKTASSERLLDHVRLIWLTPAMNTLFTGPAGDRRRFLDRMVLSIDPEHIRRTLTYERVMRARNKVLENPPFDAAFLEALEMQIAEWGVSIAAARCTFESHLLHIIEGLDFSQHGFPKALVRVSGELEDQFGTRSALDIEDWFRKKLKDSRPRDAAAGRMLNGVHRSDLNVMHFEKNRPAAQSSTGEQKALLLGLFLAHAFLIARLDERTPIILMDEIAAHLDENRRRALFDILEQLGSQCWLTGTEEALFSPLLPRAQTFQVDNGQIKSCRAF